MNTCLIHQLIASGVQYFCLAPGNRSAPLSVAVAENPKAETLIHFDERGCAFHALGYARATQKPAAVIVTSGTAVGNLMPAVMEAYHAQVPLILLTCDRPDELRDTMANQTTDQIKIFGSFVRYFVDLPTTLPPNAKNFLGTTVSQAVAKTQYPIKGPVQINCPFREPFFMGQEEVLSNNTHYHFPKLTLNNSEKWAKRLSSTQRGVIVLGEGANAPSAALISKKLSWPIFADILSGHRGNPNQIAHYHHILKSLPDLSAELILYMGGPMVSKETLQWMGRQEQVIHVAEHPNRCDPMHCIKERVICAPEEFCKAVEIHLQEKQGNWLSKWQNLSEIVRKHCEIPNLSEPSVFKWLEKIDTALFIGNSMPIRDADAFFFPKNSRPIFGNRGLSGIDGNIATACGIAQTMPLTAVIGDQTALHDLNSLAMLKKTFLPLQLIIINNGGGGIFSFVGEKLNEEIREPYFAAAHCQTFEKAASLFDLGYTLVEKMEDLDKWDEIIEFQTLRDQNYDLHKQIDQAIKEALCSSVSTAF